MGAKAEVVGGALTVAIINTHLLMLSACFCPLKSYGGALRGHPMAYHLVEIPIELISESLFHSWVFHH